MLNYFALLAFGIILEILIYAIHEIKTESLAKSQHANLKLFQMRAYALSSAGWPFVVAFMLQKEWLSGVFGASILLIMSGVFPLLLFLLDIYFLLQQNSVDIEKSEVKQREYVNVTSMVLSAVFAFGVCLSAIGGSEKRSSRAAIITLSGLLLGIAFVVPVFDADSNSTMALKIQAVTKCICVYSVSLFVLGATLELLYMKNRS